MVIDKTTRDLLVAYLYFSMSHIISLAINLYLFILFPHLVAFLLLVLVVLLSIWLHMNGYVGSFHSLQLNSLSTAKGLNIVAFKRKQLRFLGHVFRRL